MKKEHPIDRAVRGYRAIQHAACARPLVGMIQAVFPLCILALLLHQFRLEATGLYRFTNNVLIIDLNTQLLRHSLADGVAACAVLAADGNYFIIVKK